MQNHLAASAREVISAAGLAGGGWGGRKHLQDVSVNPVMITKTQERLLRNGQIRSSLPQDGCTWDLFHQPIV